MNRAERRRQARRMAREGGAQMEAAAERGETPISFFTDSGQYDNAEAAVDLPSKEPGRHRWIAIASYTMDEADVINEGNFQAGASTKRTMLDSSRRFMFGITCYDCEESFPHIKPGSTCPALAIDDPI